MKRILLVLPFLLAACDSGLTAPSKNLVPNAASMNASSATCLVPIGGVMTTVHMGFDQWGYNRCARVFNGTYSSWCEERGAGPDCAGSLYSSDQLIMKWNAEWDRGNSEGWSSPPYSAWLDNEANGMKPDGSGAVWHYKYQWVGSCGADGTQLEDGGYCIWGIFEVLMDQGRDPNLSFPGHQWFARATPNGYGN
jgi:hypothetical protein